MLRVIFCFSLLFSSLISLAQHRCATVEYEKMLMQRHPSRETIDQFELWMKEKIAQKQANTLAYRVMSSNSYIVPVVVHVIHNGEAVGTGTNISDAQILSQIKVLNDDFQRLNADSVNTPGEFVSVEGKFNITFVLAKQDPDGAATNGIVRVKGSQTSWDATTDNYTLKAESYWPAEEYLNIWVANLSGGYLGYTQLPTTSLVGGLDKSTNTIDRLTDGIVIHYKSFGTKAAGSFDLIPGYDLGRTVTHETGHFFGLRHVWGDIFSCSGTDYVDDTPPQNTDFNGTCPSTAQLRCAVDAMYSNYMNYTDDACMNIFSKGQVARMDIVINNCPRRASLLTSIGSQAPTLFSNDIQLKSIITPGLMACTNSSPSLLVRNLGTNSITSSQIQFLLNGSPVETKLFPLTLAPSEQSSVSFSPLSLSAGSTYKFSFKVLQTNGNTDGGVYNDTISVTSKAPSQVTVPWIEPFNTSANWSIINPDGLKTWSMWTAPVGSSNKAMVLNFYSDDDYGTSDWLISPVIDLTNATVATLSFDFAYSASSGINDRLKVLVSTSCDFNSPVEVFNRAGTSLATTPNYYSNFVPQASDWATQLIALNQFLGQKIQVAFVGVNDYGNNFYLDNVSVSNVSFSSFALIDLVSPSPVSCMNSASPVISIKNMGNQVIDSFTTDVYVNDQLLTSQQITNAQISLSTTKQISLPTIDFSTGTNNVSVVIKYPNGTSSKDSLGTIRIINESTDHVPLIENFNSPSSTWTTVSPGSGVNWNSVSTTKGLSMEYEAFANTNIGEKAWLVSPVLDFSKLDSASITFETSYAYGSGGGETLKIYSSTDCGVNFDELLFSRSASELANEVTSSAWLPTDNSYWTKHHQSLQTLAGKKDVRLAFIVTNGSGNNLFLDNIEFYAEENLPTVDGSYSVYGGWGSPVKISFDLQERQIVRVQVYDLLGNVIQDNQLPDTLNQTYVLELAQASGIYIVRVQTQSPSSTTSTKVLFGF